MSGAPPAPKGERPVDEQEATLPITRVTLYTSGVGYFERGGEVEGEARLTLRFPVGQINDVLKSLVLLDGGTGAAIQPVTYAAQDPAGRALQAFSVDLGDNPSRATLLNRMRGTSITVTTGKSDTLTGVIVGVEEQTVQAPEGGVTEQHTLNLLAEDGLHAVPLSDARRLAFNDARLTEELRQALAAVAQGRDAGKRPLTLTFSGQGRRPVFVGYIAEAPAWQTTYRLVLGGDAPLLQGWALVQNTGQDDWNDARLTLVSGRPISFIQDLYTPLYVHRPRVSPRIPASPIPQTYDSDLLTPDRARAYGDIDFGPAEAAYSAAPAVGGRARKASAAAGAPAAAPAPLGEAARQNLASTGAQLGTALFAYHIDVPVSLPRQQSAMIPFTAAEVQAERVSVYNAQVQKDHPLSGVRLNNTTPLHLMGGPLTVFDEGGGQGYVGDALMDDTEPGQTRLLTYAMDLAVDVEVKPGPHNNAVFSVTITQGVLQVLHQYRQATNYTFKNNAAAPRTVVVEHPNTAWTLIEPEIPAERTAQWHRFDVPVPAGASVNLVVREERTGRQDLSLFTHDLEQLLHFSTSGEAGQVVQAALTEVAARRRRLAEIDTEIDDIDGRRAAISTEQARIRQNMQNLEYKSDLYKRYVGELDAQETQIQTLQAQRDARLGEQAAAQTALNEFLAGLALS